MNSVLIGPGSTRQTRHAASSKARGGAHRSSTPGRPWSRHRHPGPSWATQVIAEPMLMIIPRRSINDGKQSRVEHERASEIDRELAARWSGSASAKRSAGPARRC